MQRGPGVRVGCGETRLGPTGRDSPSRLTVLGGQGSSGTPPSCRLTTDIETPATLGSEEGNRGRVTHREPVTGGGDWRPSRSDRGLVRGVSDRCPSRDGAVRPWSTVPSMPRRPGGTREGTSRSQGPSRASTSVFSRRTVYPARTTRRDPPFVLPIP